MLRVAGVSTAGNAGGRDARRLLDLLYREQLGIPMPRLLRHDRGKPYFETGELHCSIAHTRFMAFCALSDFSLGLDAEALDRPIRKGLPEKVLSPQEYRAWQQALRPGRFFLALWTLKEACVKYTGEGLQGFPSHLSFDLSGPRPVLAGSGLYFALQTCAGHVVALCAEQPIELRVELRRFV